MIHKFKIDDRGFLLDVNSGAIHSVDDTAYDIADSVCNSCSLEAVTDAFGSKHKPEDIKTAYSELIHLKEKGELDSSDDYFDDFSKFEKKPVIKAACMHVSHDCNIRCKYCFASQGDFKGERSLMSFETGRKALEFLAKNSGLRRNLEVDFFGGEPLMNFETVKQLVSYARSIEKKYNKVFRFTVTTNGILLDDENIDFINENMENVVLSIDGRKSTNDFMRHCINGSGTYDIILPKFKKLVDKRPADKSYYVRGTFTKYNTDFANDVIHLADQGFKLTSVEPVVSLPNNDYALSAKDLPVIFEQYENLAKEMVSRIGGEDEFDFFHYMLDLDRGPCAIKRVSGCGAGTEYIAVTPEGDIYPCHRFVGDPDFRIGDVDEGIIKHELTDRFNSAHVYSKNECMTCWAKFYCSGGCHANAYNFNKSLLKPYETGCEMERKRIECAIYLQAERFNHKY